MWTRGEFIRNQKLTILAIFVIIFALIFLSGSQALSKGRPSRANYCAVFGFGGDIEGEGLVGIKRDSATSPVGTFTLEFSEKIKNIGIFAGEHEGGWLSVGGNKLSGTANFYYGFSMGGENYSLSGSGKYERNKKEGTLYFWFEGDEFEIRGPPITIQWSGRLTFDIYVTPLDQCDDTDCPCVPKGD